MKTAFAQRVRETTARVTISSRVFGPEEIESLKVVRGLSNADEFVIGSSFSKMLELTLIDKHGTLDQLEYAGAFADVEIGVKVGGVYQYQPIGRYILEKPKWERKTRLSMIGFDEMQKADVPYPNTLEYPATLEQVFQDACNVAGLPFDATAFPNSTVQIIQRPLMYDITCRGVMEHVAGLAGGYCLFESGSVRIVNISADDISVTSSNIKSMQRDEERGTKINKLVMQQTGAEDYIVGTGDNPYYLTDNIFIQGDPERWATAIFEQINGINFFPAEISFNGNPTGAVNKYVDVEFLGTVYPVLPSIRTITFHGGLREEWSCKHLSNEPATASERLVQSIRKNETKLLVVEGEINAKVSQADYEQDMDVVNNRLQTAEFKISPEQISQSIKTTVTNDTDLQALIKGEDGAPGADGAPGPPGADGADGADGQPTYTWVKYADTATGAGMSDSSTGKRYIGLAFNKPTVTGSDTPGDYEWSPLYDHVKVGGRNLIVDSDDATAWQYLSHDEAIYPIIDEIYEDHRRIRRNPDFVTYPSTTFSNLSTLFPPSVGGEEYTDSIEVKPEQDISLGHSISSAVLCPADKWTRISHTFIANQAKQQFMMLTSPTPFSESFNPWVEYRLTKREKGNVATDWTPAPEDIDERFSEQDDTLSDLATISQTNTSLINQTNDTITTLVSQEAYQTSINDLQEDLEGYVASEVETRITNYNSEVEQRFDSVTTTFSSVTTDISNLNNELQASLDEISTYIRFDIDGIELGELGSPIKLFIENDRIVFKQNDVEVAYINNNRLYITDGQFLNSLRLGDFAFTPRSNGNLSFGKVM